MPKRKYAFTKGGALRLEIPSKDTWNWNIFGRNLGQNWKDVSVRLDGKEIGTIANKKMLKEGREFYLEDGSVLKVQLSSQFFNWLSGELRVTLNGKPLYVSELNALIGAYLSIFYIGGSSILVGLLGEVSKAGFSTDLSYGFLDIVYGVVFLLLGFFVKRKSAIALTIAVILHSLSILFGIVLMLTSPQEAQSNSGGNVGRVDLLFL